MITLRTVIASLAFVSFASAHIVISYPGWRGDNLHANGSYNVDDYKPDLFPYGMQWMYPCGGLRITSNRTYWPTTGGAVAFQPGWFQGHKTALLYINLGLGNVPENYSLPMQKQWQITGPDNEAYPGSEICMPQVPLPANVTVKEGDNATIQVVESAQHGAALYSCVDITFTNNMDLVNKVNESNCHNNSDVQFGTIFATRSLTADGAASIREAPRIMGMLGTAVLAVAAWSLL